MTAAVLAAILALTSATVVPEAAPRTVGEVVPKAETGNTVKAAQGQTKREVPVTSEPQLTAPSRVASKDDYEAPCRYGDENRRSDLCAQWKAADAASKAALWSFWTFLSSTVIGLIGLCGLFFTVRYARKAWLASQQATSIANEALKVTRDTSQLELRAYLSVLVGSATYQETAKSLRFAVNPSLVNGGNTPARQVRYVANAAILPVPLPDNFKFPLAGAEKKRGGIVPAGHAFILSAVVPDFVAETEISHICQAQGRAVYTWGWVIYRDVFGKKHRTTFCQWVAWGTDGNVSGWYHPKHNRAS